MVKLNWAAAAAAGALVLTGGNVLADNHATLGALAWGDHRAEGHRERNRYRHPVETLSFFGVTPEMTVVEVSPGASGWYTEILAPYLRDKGKFYAAGYDGKSEREYYRNAQARFQAKLDAMPEVYGKVEQTVFQLPDRTEIAPPGSADVVLTFRNTHNWMQGGNARTAFEAMHAALKPGGVLGLVQHRGIPGNPDYRSGELGYLDENYLIGFVESIGFELVDSSEINANLADTKDYERGVWTLPPNLRGDDALRDEYIAIGESDRMTLKFVKR
jgi:predicted methyltransferase